MGPVQINNRISVHQHNELGGRPNFDEILMIKLLVLQSMYGLSDPELERQANDKISFLKFLVFPEKIPDPVLH